MLTRLGVPRLWKEDPEVLWSFMRYAVAPIVYGLTRAVAYGVERVPESGGAVIAANHLNAVDHPLVGLVCPRPVYFISKAELFEIPVVGEVLGWTGAFPVHRGEPDRVALRQARGLLAAGKLVCFHIEGTRQRSGQPGAARKGAAMVATQESVPIVPCGLETYGWSLGRPRRCAVVWGEPITIADLSRGRKGRAEATELIRIEVARLWELASEAVVDAFPPAVSDGTARSTLPKPAVRGLRRTVAHSNGRGGRG